MSYNTSNMYNRARNIATGKTDLEVSYTTVGLLLVLGIAYTAIAALGIDIFSKCDAVKGNKVQENLNKYLAATLTIGLTIPFTLLVTKFVSSEGIAFSMIYAIMGIVGSSAALNWTMKCPDADKSAKTYSGISLASFLCVFLIAAYMARPTSKNI